MCTSPRGLSSISVLNVLRANSLDLVVSLIYLCCVEMGMGIQCIVGLSVPNLNLRILDVLIIGTRACLEHFIFIAYFIIFLYYVVNYLEMYLKLNGIKEKFAIFISHQCERLKMFLF